MYIHCSLQVRNLPHVDFIEEEGMAVGVQDESLSWHLDRLDQQTLPLDLTYSPIGDGKGVDVYILDSGINYKHEDFEYRAKYAGYDPVDALDAALEGNPIPQYGADCHGHGTYVASACGGKTYGVAKKVTMYSIRVLQCNNTAPWSTLLDGLDYLSRITDERKRPVIACIPLTGSYNHVVNKAIETLSKQGIHIVSAAGNGMFDSCSRSPASSPYVTTVGGSSDGDRLYTRNGGTNYGECIDIFAPGEQVKSADYNCLNCFSLVSGTSMSTSIVSGVAAIHLSRQPLLTPDQLKQKLINDSSKGVLNFTGIPIASWANTPNKLLHIPGNDSFLLMLYVAQTTCSESYLY